MYKLVAYLTVVGLLWGMINDVSTTTAPSQVSKIVNTIAEQFGKQCQKEDGYDTIKMLIKNLAETFGTLTTKELIAYLRGESSSEAITNLYFAAVDKTYERNSIENKIFKAYFTNLLRFNAYKLFLVYIGSPLGQAGLLRDTATETCKAFEANAAECAVLVDSIGCLEKNLSHQANIGAAMAAAVLKN